MQSVLPLPMPLFPTAASERISDGVLADMFLLDVRFVRAQNSFTRDLLISRAIESGYIQRDWSPLSHNYERVLEDLSRAILGHWSKLLTPIEREERCHVLFVIKHLKRQYQVNNQPLRSINHV